MEWVAIPWRNLQKGIDDFAKKGGGEREGGESNGEAKDSGDLGKIPCIIQWMEEKG